MAPIWCQEACAGSFTLTLFSSFFRRVSFRLFLCCFGFYFDTLFVDLDCISCRFGLHFGTLLAGLGFFPSVLAPGALPERSWKPSTTPVGFLMICCWIFTSNSVHMSYNLKTCAVSCSLILLPCPCFCAAQRSAAQRAATLALCCLPKQHVLGVLST